MSQVNYHPVLYFNVNEHSIIKRREKTEIILFLSPIDLSHRVKLMGKSSLFEAQI